MAHVRRRTVVSALTGWSGVASVSGISGLGSLALLAPSRANAQDNKAAASAAAGSSAHGNFTVNAPATSASSSASSPAASAPPSATTTTRTPVGRGDLGPLLVERLRTDGIALAAMRLRGDRVDQGVAVLQGDLPDEDTLFELGSITKTFTALLLADAVVRGELKLEDPVEVVLPGGLKLRDSAGLPLRWRDLATHRSGLPRLPANLLPKAGVVDPYADYDWPAMAEFLASWKPEIPRDTRYEYSNLGYGLLGQALAFAAETDYATLLGRRVLVPLGLSRHIVFSAPTAGPRLLEGHDPDGVKVPHWRFRPAMAGAGALLGSLRGVIRFAQAALGRIDHPLKEAFALCLRRHGDLAAPQAEMGLAWQLGPVRDRTLFNHDGATRGFSSSLWLDPARQEASAVLSNAHISIRPLALHLIEPSQPVQSSARPAMPAPANFPSTVPVTAEQLTELAGTFAFTPDFKLVVRADGLRLFARATGQPEFELFAMAPRRFFAKVTALQIEFDGDGGRPAKLTLYQAGIVKDAPREPPP